MCHQLTKARDAVEAETEAKLEALEQLRHAERLSMLGRVSSGLAHELGTPLNIVTGRAKIIADSAPDSETISTGTRIIREQVDRMSRIIRQLLDYSRRQTGNRQPEHLEKLAENVLGMLAPTATSAGVKFDLVKRSDLPAITVDRFKVEQALMNLIMNGIQAMPDGGVLGVEVGQARCRPSADRKGDDRNCLVVKVVDTGVGIPEGDRSLVCEPFFTTKKVGQGTGLGMSIVQGILKEHSGWLEIESEEGRGTTVAIFLPLEVKA
jgi:signal transduction histidine kinase